MNEDFNNRCGQCEVHKFIECKNGFGGCPRSQISPLFNASDTENASYSARANPLPNGYEDAVNRIIDVTDKIKKLKEEDDDLAFENEVLSLERLAGKIAEIKNELQKRRVPSTVLDEMKKVWMAQGEECLEAEELEGMLQIDTVRCPEDGFGFVDKHAYFGDPEAMSALRKTMIDHAAKVWLGRKAHAVCGS